MKKVPKFVLLDGWAPALGAILLVGAASAMVAVSSWARSQTAARLAILGVMLFVIALILGSSRLVGLTSLPVLAAALISTIGGDDPSWMRALVVGILWYGAAELGWYAIERRDGVRRTSAYNSRRLDETNVVVLLSLTVTAVVFLLSSVAPIRTVFVLAIVLLGIAWALAGATRRLRRTGGPAAEPGPLTERRLGAADESQLIRVLGDRGSRRDR